MWYDSLFSPFQVYWAAPMSAGLAAALVYDYLLIPRSEPFSERAKVLCCSGPEMDDIDREPLLDDLKEDEHSCKQSV